MFGGIFEETCAAFSSADDSNPLAPLPAHGHRRDGRDTPVHPSTQGVQNLATWRDDGLAPAAEKERSRIRRRGRAAQRQGRSLRGVGRRAIDALAMPLGYDWRAVFDTRRHGQWVRRRRVTIGASHGPAQAVSCFEAKTAGLCSAPDVAPLDEANRDATD